MSDQKSNPSVGRRFYKNTYIDEEVFKTLAVEKIRILQKYPFWGIIALKLVWVEEPLVPTMGTDGLHIFYNAEFVKSLRPREVPFVIAHELYHCVMNHCGGRESRIGNRDPKLWNIACDFVTNAEIKSTGIGEFVTSVNIVYDEKFDNWSAEGVYKYLIDNPDALEQMGFTMDDQFDEHYDIEIVDENGMPVDGGARDGQDGDGNGNGRKKIQMTEEEFAKHAKGWQQTIQRAAAEQEQHPGTGAGNSIPSSIQRMIGELTKPKKNWKKALRAYMRQVVSRGYSYRRPNKSLFNQGFTIPGFRAETDILEISIAVDTSGSVPEEMLTGFVSEIHGILSSVPNYKINAFCFGGNVLKDSCVTITKNSKSAINDLVPFIDKMGDGGGTQFESIWHHLSETKHKPKALLVLTDGYPCGSWGIPGYCPTIFLVAGNEHRPVAPFGITMYYEDAD